MNRFLIVVNPDKDTDLIITNRIQEYVKAHGGMCVAKNVFDFTAEDIREKQELTNQENGKADGSFDCILVLGGDGTLLRVAGEIEDMDIPLFGINLGTVGFLTEGEVSNIDEILERLLTGDYSIQERMMITGTVTKTDGTRYTKGALNDIVISRAGFSRLIGLNVSVDEQVLDTYEADGVVVSTPTGSTGYNLSAGGPIVSPDAQLIVITPVSPHSLTSKSIVLSGNEKITIEITKKRKTQDTEAICSFDGGNDVELSVGDKVDIYQSGKITKLIKASDVNFYEILRNKLGGS